MVEFIETNAYDKKILKNLLIKSFYKKLSGLKSLLKEEKDSKKILEINKKIEVLEQEFDEKFKEYADVEDEESLEGHIDDKITDSVIEKFFELNNKECDNRIRDFNERIEKVTQIFENFFGLKYEDYVKNYRSLNNDNLLVQKKNTAIESPENNEIGIDIEGDIIDIIDIRNKDNIIDIRNSKDNITENKDSKYNIIKDSKYNTTENSKDNLIPIFLQNFLYEFQIDGVKFLLKDKDKILADEMGLGKTIQAISAVASHHLYNNDNKPSLILGPLSILTQWASEIYKFFPFFRVLILHGNFKEIQKVKEINYPSIIITSYETFKLNITELEKTKYSFFILDEGHKIKSFKTKIFENVKKIKANKKIILSGTPIQNNLKELWSLMNFLAPKVLGDYSTFYKNFEEKITKKGNDENKKNLMTYLKFLIDPYILRRNKSIVKKQLPKKKEKIILCPMTVLQEKLYIEELSKQQQFWENNKNEMERKPILAGIHRLRKIANHPLIADDCFEENDSEKNHKIDLKKVKLEELKVGKFAVMKKLLHGFLKEKRKTIIFSQTRSMVNLISAYLNKKRIRHITIMGNTQLSERSIKLKKFQDSENLNILIITTRVGSLGLNLVAASRLIIYDPDWNPSVDSQARDRIFRFGQKNDIETFLLLSKNTIEEHVYQKQVFKTLLAMEVLNEKGKSELISEMKNLLKYESPKEKYGIVKDYSQKEENNNFFTENTDICNLSGSELIKFIRYRESHFN